jgi:ABC-2 type transport system permease protein
MKSYLSLARGNFMVGLTYRAGFIFLILGSIIYITVAYFLWQSIYANSQSLNGLTFEQTFLYVALGSAVFVFLKTYADWFISSDIREGTIITTLIKPIDYQLYALFSSFGFGLTNLVGVTVPTLVLLFAVFRVPVASGPGLAFFPVSLVLAFIISFTLDYFVGLLAFYTESVWGLSMTKEIIVTVLAGALIPLQFFPQAIQQVLRWLPFQAIYFTPLMMVTKPDSDVQQLTIMLLVQVFWAAVLLLLTRLFYHRAINVLRVSGG